MQRHNKFWNFLHNIENSMCCNIFTIVPMLILITLLDSAVPQLPQKESLSMDHKIVDYRYKYMRIGHQKVRIYTFCNISNTLSIFLYDSINSWVYSQPLKKSAVFGHNWRHFINIPCKFSNFLSNSILKLNKIIKIQLESCI